MTGRSHLEIHLAGLLTHKGRERPEQAAATHRWVQNLIYDLQTRSSTEFHETTDWVSEPGSEELAEENNL